MVRTSGADLGLEHSVVVLGAVHRWPTFDSLFFSRGEAQLGDQDNRVVLIAHEFMYICRSQMLMSETEFLFTKRL